MHQPDTHHLKVDNHIIESISRCQVHFRRLPPWRYRGATFGLDGVGLGRVLEYLKVTCSLKVTPAVELFSFEKPVH